MDYWIAEYFVQDFCPGSNAGRVDESTVLANRLFSDTACLHAELDDEDDEAMPSRDAQIFGASWLLQFEGSCGYSPPVRAVLALINTIKQSPLSASAAPLSTAMKVGGLGDGEWIHLPYWSLSAM